MQVLLHSDPNTDGSASMVEHLSAVVEKALGRFGERITRVEAHLSDANSDAKPGTEGSGDIHCSLEARLAGLDAVIVKHHARSAHEAIEGALRKLKRAAGSEIAKHDPRGRKELAAAPTVDQAIDQAG